MVQVADEGRTERDLTALEVGDDTEERAELSLFGRLSRMLGKEFARLALTRRVQIEARVVRRVG